MRQSIWQCSRDTEPTPAGDWSLISALSHLRCGVNVVGVRCRFLGWCTESGVRGVPRVAAVCSFAGFGTSELTAPG